MAIKYFCDLCESEVQRKVLLDTIQLSPIDVEEARTYNRNDLENYILGLKHEICINCRVSIMKFLSSLKKK